MINIDRGQGIEQMDESLLEGPFYHITDNEHEHTIATEYKLKGAVVHRSVHVHLKKGLGFEAFLGQMGG